MSFSGRKKIISREVVHGSIKNVYLCTRLDGSFHATKIPVQSNEKKFLVFSEIFLSSPKTGKKVKNHFLGF